MAEAASGGSLLRLIGVISSQVSNKSGWDRVCVVMFVAIYLFKLFGMQRGYGFLNHQITLQEPIECSDRSVRSLQCDRLRKPLVQQSG